MWLQRIASSAVLALLVSLPCCSSVPTEIHVFEPDAAFEQLTRFAFTSRRPAAGALPGLPVVDSQLLEEARGAVAAGLERRGMRQVTVSEADVLVAVQLAVEEHQRVSDPYFEIYGVEDYEDGVMLLELLDPASRRTIWSGSARSTLRLLGKHVGMHADVYRAYDQPREWRLEDKAEALVGDLPRAR